MQDIYYTPRECTLKGNPSEKAIPVPIPTWGIFALLVNALQALGLGRFVVGQTPPTSLGCHKVHSLAHVHTCARPTSRRLGMMSKFN